MSLHSFLRLVGVKKEAGIKHVMFLFLAFATKNRNRATARFRFFLCSYERLFLYVCQSLFHFIFILIFESYAH